jgi:hypothetical protein
MIERVKNGRSFADGVEHAIGRAPDRVKRALRR